jgi:hypothetical protein
MLVADQFIQMSAMALSGHSDLIAECLLLGVKRASFREKRTSHRRATLPDRIHQTAVHAFGSELRQRHHWTQTMKT